MPNCTFFSFWKQGKWFADERRPFSPKTFAVQPRGSGLTTEVGPGRVREKTGSGRVRDKTGRGGSMKGYGKRLPALFWNPSLCETLFAVESKKWKLFLNNIIIQDLCAKNINLLFTTTKITICIRINGVQQTSLMVLFEELLGSGILGWLRLHSSYKSIKWMWGGEGLINLGQCSWIVRH